MNSPCATGSIFGRLGCILDYDRNLVDVAINYSLFFVNLAVCVLALRLHTKDIEKSNKLRSYALASLIFGKQQTHTHNPVINDSACPKRDSHTHNRQIFFAFGALLFGCFLDEQKSLSFRWFFVCFWVAWVFRLFGVPWVVGSLANDDGCANRVTRN